jgi:GT2 family glycosyltransferase
VIILAFNSEYFVREAVDSVLAELARRVSVEVIVLDNGSRDGTYALLNGHYRDHHAVRVFRSERGLGYAAGNNLAAERANGEILLFLNDDCVVEPGALSALISDFSDDPAVGLVQCAVAVADGSRWDTLGHFLDVWGLLHAVGSNWPRSTLPLHRYQLFAGSGAALAVRSETFRRLRGFDFEYELLFEETDLCWRAQLLGHGVAGSVRAVVRHRQLARYANPGSGLPSAFYLETRNRIRGLIKNLSAWRLLVALPIHLSARLLFALRELCRRRPGALWDVARAIAWNAARLPSTLRSRQEIQRTRVVSDDDLVVAGKLLRPRLVAGRLTTVPPIEQLINKCPEWEV